ncbi:DUF937 domain-containing protein [Dysgonomonas sp. 520]|uniref:DUF937 domain-containing protein n=1 Tax=Dysgonomonas sp. 520 TaxID=2302931 RepID=UPI0013D246DE|nr:DUF937 domain-containing protein [Dysgonomonas sp. 520]
MLDGIIDLVKKEALGVITNNADVPAEKQNEAVDTTASAILSSLKDHISFENIGAITSLLSNGANSEGANNIVSGVQSSVVSALTSKVGLNQGVANTIATAVVPAIIGIFTKKNNDPNDTGFNVESLIKTFTGGGGMGGILGAIGSLFGRK